MTAARETGKAIQRLRSMAVGASLFVPTSLEQAVAAMEFVQYDPIRSPSRAQDLILHQRVRDYRAGDLGRAYPRLGLEEGYLHVYGAMTPRLAALVDPRTQALPDGTGYAPSGLAAEVLEMVHECEVVHPREVAARLGNDQVTNAWGGISSATTRALDELHHHWLVRVVGRDRGVKLYGPARPPAEAAADWDERVRRLTLHLARTLMPVPVPSLRSALVQLRRRGGIDASLGVDALLRSAALRQEVVAGLAYVWPADVPPPAEAAPRKVRLLAPFDPVVWDRRRFEHLWGWQYRFEAYTPVAKRRFGYYAIPMFAGNQAVGWVQCRTSSGHLSVTVHFVGRRPVGKAFREGLGREVDRLARMVGLTVGSVAWR
jgi:uncharacterized protein YcaQ